MHSHMKRDTKYLIIIFINIGIIVSETSTIVYIPYFIHINHLLHVHELRIRTDYKLKGYNAEVLHL